MLTFEQFLRDAAAKGEFVNLVFEQRLFELIGTLHQISEALQSEGVPHAVVGGLAVLIHVEAADPTHSMLTRDVDLLIRRKDLDRVKNIAARHGFLFRHTAGLDMPLYGETNSARNAIHLLFSGEQVKATQATPNPEVAPEQKSIHGRAVPVVSVADLLRMKLSSYRDKDRVHVRSMDAAGLLTAEVEQALPVELRERLEHVRATE